MQSDMKKAYRAGQRWAKTDTAYDNDGEQNSAEAKRRYGDNAVLRSMFLYGMYDQWRADNAPVMDS